MTFAIALLVILFLVFVVPGLMNKYVSPRVHPPTPSNEVKFFGGPLDSQVHEVPRRSDYYIAPYLPEDESDRKHLGQVGNQVFFEPSLAYYRQVTEESYFYVRDISAAEMEKLYQHNMLPEIEAKDE